MGAAPFENMALPALPVDVAPWAGPLLVVWCVGLILGWLLPRPNWAKRKRAFMMTAPGLWLGRASLTFNIFLVVREVWYLFCQPGTFRAILRATWASLITGQPFRWPSITPGTTLADASTPTPALSDSLRWYVTSADLQTFKDTVEAENGPVWEKMLHKQWDGCTYTAWRRSLPSGRTEYKSVTLSEDATAQEFMDFYLDDDVRPKWDAMITETQLLETAHDGAHRCQVVRWLRSFPFAFLSRREYVIARRVFRAPDAPNTIYGITKGVEHPAAPRAPGVVRMASYYSMWRSRTLPCPQGSGRPLCETTLLHFEDFGIPEHLARFTVRHGMAGFVAKMVPVVRSFVDERRSRGVGSYNEDSAAYGAALTPVMAAGAAPPLSAVADELCEPPPTPSSGTGMLRSSSVRGFGYMLLASGMALALSRTGSSPSLVGGAGVPTPAEESRTAGRRGHVGGVLLGRKRHHGRHHGAHGTHAVLHHPHGGAAKHHGHGHGHRSGAATAGLRSHRVSHADADHA